MSVCPFEEINNTSFAIPDPDDCGWFISCIGVNQYVSRPCVSPHVFTFDKMFNADDPCDVDNDCGDEIIIPTTPRMYSLHL